MQSKKAYKKIVVLLFFCTHGLFFAYFASLQNLSFFNRGGGRKRKKTKHGDAAPTWRETRREGAQDASEANPRTLTGHSRADKSCEAAPERAKKPDTKERKSTDYCRRD